MNMHFSKSNHEISYSDTRLQPLIFQDDLFRICANAVDAQAGNRIMEAVMESKLLDLNLDKSCYIVVGGQKNTKIKSELEANTLFLSGKEMKEKVCDKYLGDYIHTLGTAASVQCTIEHRAGLVQASQRAGPSLRTAE